MQCRTCLRRPGSLRPLFGAGAGGRALMLADVLSHPVSEDDQMPAHICVSCLSHLQIAYRFRKKCELSHKLLLNMLAIENQDYVNLNLDDICKDDALALYGDFKIDSLDTFENDIQLEFEVFKDGEDINIPQSVELELLVTENKDDESPAKEEDEKPPPVVKKPRRGRKSIRIDTKKYGYFIESNKDDIGLESDYLEALYKIYKHRCTHCPRIYAVASYFKVHVNSHLGIKPYLCEICNKSFPDERSHVKYHKQRKEKGTYKCHFCERAYNCRGSLRTHMKLHTGEVKWFPCTQCTRKFNQLNKLKNHMVVHSNDRNYVCQYCSKAFRFDRNLKSHIRSIHVKIRAYICDICSKGFTTTHELTLHKRRHLGIKKYNCPQCLLCFVSSSEVRSHVQSVHNKNKNYACRNCGVRFSRASQRNTHENSKQCVATNNTLDIIDKELSEAVDAGRFADDFTPRRGRQKTLDLIEECFVLESELIQ